MVTWFPDDGRWFGRLEPFLTTTRSTVIRNDNDGNTDDTLRGLLPR